MPNAGLDEAQARVKISGRNISDLRYTDDTTLFAFCHKGGVICISKVTDISPCNLDSSLCFIQPSISHNVLYIKEKEMATHYTLAWRIPWTEEPGRLQSMGLQSRTRLSDFTFTFLQNFPQFIVIQTVKGFGIVNKAEVDVFFWNSLPFSMIQLMLAI